ncbi:MAG: HAD family phosphatase [Lachnospiraceae bacterium]|nr:HAD family phosphatase [Lachnospiraceae bacterium]
MKLIFLDIDGTLTVAGENVPPESALAAIRKSQAKGNKVFLCTGRNLDMLSPLLKYGFDGVVASGGGYVAVGEEVLYDCPMTDTQKNTALESLHRHGVFCTIEAKDGSWGDENMDAFLKDQPAGNSEIERWRKALSENLGIRPMSEYDGRPIYKVVIMCNEMKQLEEAKKLLEQDFRFVLQEVPAHGCLNGELVNRQFDKGKGVELVCRKYNVPLEDSIGFGDSMNDLEMIQTVGVSVCMANGAKALQEIADIVCPAVEEDGLAKAFENLGLL